MLAEHGNIQWELISDGIILRLHFAVNLTVHR